MKDQYFGDFGDYQKISLLALLSKRLKIITHWMKTLDDGGTDGKHISYLKKASVWRIFEPDIFDFIEEKIKSKNRSLSHIENSLYGKDIRFISKYIESRDAREKILRDICADNTRDIVFFDPDNGIEVQSTNNKNAHKYVMWEEMLKTLESGKSVLVYQHFSRTNRAAFIKNKLDEITRRLKTSGLALQVKHSVYFFILQEKHKKAGEKAVEEFAKTWKELAIVY